MRYAAMFSELSRSTVGFMILTISLGVAGKTPEEIRKTFNIKNDFTPVRLRFK